MKTAEIQNIRRNIMGTISFEMKAGKMRKHQDFIVYPLDKDSDCKVIKVQSERYWAEIDIINGIGDLSTSQENANSWTFRADSIKGNITRFMLTPIDIQSLKMQIFTSAKKEAGESTVKTDNSGAINILNI